MRFWGLRPQTPMPFKRGYGRGLTTNRGWRRLRQQPTPRGVWGATPPQPKKVNNFFSNDFESQVWLMAEAQELLKNL